MVYFSVPRPTLKKNDSPRPNGFIGPFQASTCLATESPFFNKHAHSEVFFFTRVREIGHERDGGDATFIDQTPNPCRAAINGWSVWRSEDVEAR